MAAEDARIGYLPEVAGVSNPAPDTLLTVVVDTDVVSYLFKGDTRADLYRPHVYERLAVIAAQTRAELELWMLERNWGVRRQAELREYLHRFVFAAVDEAICRAWAEATDSARRKGLPILAADAWVAATALSYDVPLVTHNSGDFAGVDNLTVISERRT